MGFVFKNLFIGESVSSNGGLVFKTLKPHPNNPNVVKIDLAALGLPPGKYVITVTSNAAGLESKHSNTVTYTVK